MHYELLANAPGPDKVPFFPCRSGPKVSIVVEDREPTRVSTHGTTFSNGGAHHRGRGPTRGWTI